jgi:hypothetical protein
MGEEFETLEDLLRPGLRVVCIGINPAPPSVAGGHYYHGRRAGKTISGSRTGSASLTSSSDRRGRRARWAGRSLSMARELLRTKIEAARPRLVLFTFKKTAEALFGQIAGNGLMQGRELGGAPSFVMPGPYAPGGEVDLWLRELSELVD